MKKKAECEQAIRYLCHEWARGRSKRELDHPSFSDFKLWLGIKGYAHYFNFRSTMGADYDAELWFDEEFKQTWRR